MSEASWTCPNDMRLQHSGNELASEFNQKKPLPARNPPAHPKTRSALVQTIKPEWAKTPCIVAAPGPSLSQEQADLVRATGWPVLVCQDAHRLLPWADKLYGCDTRWWKHYEGVPDFAGEKWSTHHHGVANNKAEDQELYGLHLVNGDRQQFAGFSLDPSVIHYGDNSGFQSINLAVLLGSPYIVLIGFDMSHKNGHHFFGKHGGSLHNQEKFERWIPEFDAAAKNLPADRTIINATPGSAIHCWKHMPLEQAIENYMLHRNGAEPDAGGCRHSPR